MNWEKKKLKGRYKIDPPKGNTDTQFIKDTMIAFARYKSKSRDYDAFPDISKNEGNCNNVTTGALVGAGVNKDEIKKLDPSGRNPGLGDPLPEMLSSNSEKCK